MCVCVSTAQSQYLLFVERVPVLFRYGAVAMRSLVSGLPSAQFSATDRCILFDYDKMALPSGHAGGLDWIFGNGSIALVWFLEYCHSQGSSGVYRAPPPPPRILTGWNMFLRVR